MGVFACQHLVGIVFVLGYSSYFFQLAGLATEDSFYMGVGGELLFTLENLTCQIC
jgi:hypothetical protein